MSDELKRYERFQETVFNSAQEPEPEAKIWYPSNSARQ